MYVINIRSSEVAGFLGEKISNLNSRWQQIYVKNSGFISYYVLHLSQQI